MSILRPALMVLLLLTLITGIAYPLVGLVLGQELFPRAAAGSLIEEAGKVRGSLLIGQSFSQAHYFQGRPSATAETPDNPLASGGSNFAVSNPQLMTRIDAQLAQLRRENPEASRQVPTELVTTSASGLDPTISLAAAQWQVPRIAQARHLPVEKIEQLLRDNSEKPRLSFLGPTVVNVVAINLALDQLTQGK